MTTYIDRTDIDFLLEGFIERYYGSNIDGAEDVSLGTQFYNDMHSSYDKVNELLGGINHIKQLPIGTQSDGNYPLHVRVIQGNWLIYQRLLAKHYGEFTDGIPGWILHYKARAEETLQDIKEQRIVFLQDVTQGESGIGIGSFTVKTGQANLFTNWDTGIYKFASYPKTYVVKITGTSSGNGVGTASFQWSDNGGYTFQGSSLTTGTQWQQLEFGVKVRWEPIGTLHCGLNDSFSFVCIPGNVPVKGNQVVQRFFLRG